MLCFEICINGKVVCLAGNEDPKGLGVNIYRRKGEGDAQIFVSGDEYVEEMWSARSVWGNQILGPGDEVSIRIVESNSPDVPLETHKVNGTKESDDLTQMIVQTVSAMWLERMLKGETIGISKESLGLKGGEESKDQSACSFCGKLPHEVEKVISGPSAFICNECVSICNDILSDSGPDPEAEKKPMARWPQR